MGSGTWSAPVYATASSLRAAKGISDFDYSDSGATSVHTSLNPASLGAAGVRESRDSTEHPQSTAIAVLLDVTSSMGAVPRSLIKKLPQLYGLLLRKGYVTDPQILFGAIGDATVDRASLQVGQFESDNRADEDLGKLYLEGGGGGQKTESYELAMWFMANKTSIDCWEKRGCRGYLFIVGDEAPYPQVKRREVAAVIGDTIQDNIPTEEVVAQLTRMYDTYYIKPAAASYVGDREVLDPWKRLLGQNVIELDDLDAVCETIALTIGLGEGMVDLETGLDDLADVGSDADSITVAGTALAELGSARGSVVTKPAPSDLEGTSGNERL